MSDNDPRDDLDVISGICQGRTLADISNIHDRGAFAASDAAVEGMLDGVTTWLIASAGPGKAYEKLMRFADRAAKELAEITREQQQRQKT